MTRPSDRRTALLLFLGVSLVYVALSRGVFLYGDDILMYQVTEAIVERGSFAVTSPHETGDNAQAIPGVDGRGYAKYGVGQSLVALPAYVAADLLAEPLLPLTVYHDDFGNQRLGALIWGTGLTNAFLGGATVALLWLLARHAGYSPPTALVLAGLLAFATLLLHYSATFLSEPLTGLALTATVYGLARAAQLDPRAALPWLLLSGFTAGLALASRLAIGVALVAPGLWLLWLAWGWARVAWRDGALACLAWSAPVALWLSGIGAYNRVRFGSVAESGYGAEASEFSAPFLTGLAGLLLSPGKGLVWHNLPLLLALAGAWNLYRRRPALALVIAGSCGATLVLFSRYYIWDGGGVWGTRFLVPLLPLLLLPAGEVVERVWRPGPRRRLATAALVVVALLGFWVSAVSVIVPFDAYVNEYNATPALKRAATWEPDAAPIVVHSRRAFDFDTGPDIAAVRYDSPRLATLSVVSAGAGLALLAVATRSVRRGGADHRCILADGPT